MSHLTLNKARKLILAEMLEQGIKTEWVYPGDITIAALTLLIEHSNDRRTKEELEAERDSMEQMKKLIFD